MLFKANPSKGYENVINALIKGYAGIGYIRKRSAVAKMLTFLLSDVKLIVKRDKVYHYGEDKTDREIFDPRPIKSVRKNTLLCSAYI